MHLAKPPFMSEKLFHLLLPPYVLGGQRRIGPPMHLVLFHPPNYTNCFGQALTPAPGSYTTLDGTGYLYVILPRYVSALRYWPAIGKDLLRYSHLRPGETARFLLISGFSRIGSMVAFHLCRLFAPSQAVELRFTFTKFLPNGT